MNKNVRLGLLLPMAGVLVAWLSMMIATYLDLGINVYDSALPRVEIKPSTYTVLIGFAIGSALVLWGFKKADALHSAGSSALVQAVYRFAGLTVVLALAADVVFAMVTFLGSLDSGAVASVSLVGRVFGTYVPILADAGLIVFVLLQATLYRKSQNVEASVEVSSAQKALALGYALPVLGTALAVIVGLVFYDIQRSSIQNWTWVVIQVIIGTSVVLGTRFAAKAKASTPVVRAPRVAGAVGAVRLNYVLSVVFAGVVAAMSFGFGTGAISSLRSYESCGEGPCVPKISGMTFDWWFNQMIPAFLLLVLVEVAVYLSITLRNKEETIA